MESHKLIYKIKEHKDEILIKASNFPKNSYGNTIFTFSLNDEKYQKSLGGYANLGGYTKKYLEKMCKVTINDPVYLMYFIWEGTYEHWMRDTIYLLHGYMELKKNIPNLKLIRYKYPHEGYYPGFIELTLELFVDIKKDVVWIDEEDQFYLAKTLYLPYTNYDKILGEANYEHLYELKWVHHELIEKAKPFSKNDYPKKIYLSRRNLKNHYHKRILVNEDEVAELLIENGYTEIFADELSFTDEINLFNNVEKVVTPVGAGCSNIFFTNENVKWLAICSNRMTGNFSLHLMRQQGNRKIFYFLDTTLIEEFVPDESTIEFNYPYKCNMEAFKTFLKENDFI